MIFRRPSINDVELQGVEKIMYIIKQYFYTDMTFVPIVPACLTFQMCYTFRKNSKIMFLSTFIPCLFVLLIALLISIFGGTFMCGPLHYGFEGFRLGLSLAFVCYTFIFPILPVCFIIQIVLVVKKLRKRKANSIKTSVSE